MVGTKVSEHGPSYQPRVFAELAATETLLFTAQVWERRFREAGALARMQTWLGAVEVLPAPRVLAPSWCCSWGKCHACRWLSTPTAHVECWLFPTSAFSSGINTKLFQGNAHRIFFLKSKHLCKNDAFQSLCRAGCNYYTEWWLAQKGKALTIHFKQLGFLLNYECNINILKPILSVIFPKELTSIIHCHHHHHHLSLTGNCSIFLHTKRWAIPPVMSYSDPFLTLREATIQGLAVCCCPTGTQKPSSAFSLKNP